MGQVALGIRSLLVKLGLFVLFAALLAWALGGTLLPRVETGRGPEAVAEDGTWFWRIEVGGPEREGIDPERPRWRLAFEPEDGGKPVPSAEPAWAEAAGPVVVVGGEQAGVWYGGRRGGAWTLLRRTGPEGEAERVLEAGRRLEIEQALARLAAGRPPIPEAVPAPEAAPAAAAPDGSGADVP